MIKLILMVIIEVIILYIGVKFLYNYYDKKEKDNDIRLNMLEKRLGEIEKRLKKIEGTNGVLIPIKDIDKFNINKIIKWLKEMKVEK